MIVRDQKANLLAFRALRLPSAPNNSVCGAHFVSRYWPSNVPQRAKVIRKIGSIENLDASVVPPLKGVTVLGPPALTASWGLLNHRPGW